MKTRFPTLSGALLAGAATLLGCATQSVAPTQANTSACKTDFDCEQGYTCDTSSGACKHGLARDNYISGSVSCILEDNPNDTGTGQVRVTGSFNGDAFELSTDVSCIFDSSPKYVYALMPDPTKRYMLSVDLPFDFLGAQGSSPMQPYVVTLDASTLMQPQLVLMDFKTSLSLAVNAGGSVTVVTPISDPTQAIKWTFDAPLQAVGAPVTCDKPCTQQLDCGAFTLGKVGETSSVCTLGQCALFCTPDATVCNENAGTCDSATSLCVRPCK